MVTSSNSQCMQKSNSGEGGGGLDDFYDTSDKYLVFRFGMLKVQAT